MKSDNSVESTKWVRSIQLVAHRIEVRALIHFKGNLFSGGIYICQYYIVFNLMNDIFDIILLQVLMDTYQ